MLRYAAAATALVGMFLFVQPGGAVAQGITSPPGQKPTEVMILGTFHFANPGADLNNVQAPDMLSPKRQKQVRAVVDSLARFRPSAIAVEQPPSEARRLDSLYQAYRADQLELKRNEIHQLGFRLAERLGHDRVHPVDHRMGLPMKKVMRYAKSHDKAFLKYMQRFRQGYVRQLDSLISAAPVLETLRFMNSAEGLAPQAAVYARTAAVGDTSNYIGADMTAAWHKRNLRIFANLASVTEPGEKVLVIFGAGHAPMLRRLVDAAPRMRLVEPNTYL